MLVSSSNPSTAGGFDRWLEPREAGIGRCPVGDLGGTPSCLREAFVVGAVRAGASNPPLARDADCHRLVDDQGRLVHDRVGEAREAGPLCLDQRIGLVPFGCTARALGELERPRRVAHDRMPTLTWRNRAGGAPCETWALCPGWPFPQFVRPPIVHSSLPASASSEPQNSGVTPM